ncbi:hypothetical protein H7F15_05830 [Pontibacter sp. Tf4]|uniref:hypothetical protein n=1 Tax=Pontibacter sp. Tf4 TaxID=2761620 RepID=UPI001627628D|nr:hypothetical protein [Pontibacter sp. Tf4]MBB6610548.1 hypothetical protein [Pontibacter sp. Tf4]
MKHFYFFLFTICSLLLISCDYSPSGSHYEEVSPTPNTAITLNLDESGDTLYARGSVSYNFTINTVGKHLYEYRMQFDGQTVLQNFEKSGSISFDTKHLTDGIHELKLLVQTGSGTGSLADKTGAERLEAYRTWVMVIDNAPPAAINIAKVYAEDGTLKITWDKYQRRYLKKIHLYRYADYGDEVRRVSYGPNDTLGYDTEYIGGSVSYMLGAEDVSGNITYGNRVPFTAPTPKLKSYKYENTNDLVLTISTNKFYNNFGKRRIELSAHDIHRKFETTNVNDSIITFKDLPFGTSFNFYLNTTPENTENANMFSVWHSSVIPGFGSENSFGPLEFTAFTPATNLFYHHKGASIKNIDATTMQVISSASYNIGSFTISNNGKYLYVSVWPNQILQLDPQSLSVINTFNLNELIPKQSYDYVYLTATNTNRLLINYIRRSGTNVSHVFDMNTGTLELTNTNSTLPAYNSISPDGQMITSPNYLYQKDSSEEWVKTYTPNVTYSELIYHPTEPLYTLYGNQTLPFYSTTTGAVVKSFTMDAGVYFSRIDPATGYVTASDSEYLYIYDINRNVLLKKIRVVHPVFFFKNRLYTNNYYLPLTF